MEEKKNESVEEEVEEETKVEVANKPPKVAPAETKPVVYKTEIKSRIDEALQAAKHVNRSADLVPLGHDFDKMRKQLKALIKACKKYQEAMTELDKARMDMIMKFSALSDKTPLHPAIGNTIEGDSYAAVQKSASEETKTATALFQEKVIDYALEWETIVTTRVDHDAAEVRKLHQTLNHYQNKLDPLRKKVNDLEAKGKAPGKKLQEKLDRNENKLEQAWKAHEKGASMLCNLLEEITQRRWKDLFPLAKDTMAWDTERASDEYDCYARLPAVIEVLSEAFFENDLPPGQEPSKVPVALTGEEKEEAKEEVSSEHVDSETTGSFHADVDETASSHSDAAVAGEEEHEEKKAPASPKREPTKAADTPTSPTAVAHI